MKELTLLVNCETCGAKNRVRLQSGRRVRIRCGRCGEQIAVGRRRLFLSLLWQRAAAFFGSVLPNYLLWAADRLIRAVGGLFSPLGNTWSRLPWRYRKRMAWAALGALGLFYFLSEGTIRFSSLFILALLLVLATLAVIVAARGPAALRELKNSLGGSLIKRCPNCGHRYFGLVKNCPECGH